MAIEGFIDKNSCESSRNSAKFYEKGYGTFSAWPPISKTLNAL